MCKAKHITDIVLDSECVEASSPPEILSMYENTASLWCSTRLQGSWERETVHMGSTWSATINQHMSHNYEWTL